MLKSRHYNVTEEREKILCLICYVSHQITVDTSISTPIIGFIIILAIIVYVLSTCIKVVPQAKAYVVERLGGYQTTWSVGISF